MQSLLKTVTEQSSEMSARNLTFVIEPEPWLRIFFRNIADLFRPAPPKVWLTSAPGEYWPDALVHRPIAWSRLRQSVLGHTLALLFIIWVNLLWVDRPRVLPEELPRTTITHYELSEYLPPVNTQTQKPVPPARRRAQKADPELARQEIVSIHANHNSLKQTIVHPNPNVLMQDIPLPNLVVATPLPGAPVAANQPLRNLPMEIPQVTAPAQPLAAKSRLTFPVLPQPEVVPPPEQVARNRVTPNFPAAAPEVVPPPASVASRQAPVLPITGPVVVPPSQPTAAHSNLNIPAQAPEVARPSTAIASRRSIRSLPDSAPQVIQPAPGVASRRSSLAQMAAAPPQVVPPAQPITAGGTSTAVGQLLVLNARPVVPEGPLTVPEGNRRGELAAAPTGRPNATARPEIAPGDNAGDNHAGNSSSVPNIYIAPPPVKVPANTSLVARASLPPVRAVPPSRADVPTDRVDSEVFGLRRRYSVRLSMPNLNSAIGSWIMRFARLNSEPGHEEEVSAPEPLRKVDPAYPASLIHDRIEGVVILYAIIHADGSVGEVRVLEGFDPQLDENARVALAQWHFSPGTRDGVPVDVEAVVHVPFRVPKPAF